MIDAINVLYAETAVKDDYIKALQGVNDKDLNIPIVYMTKEMKSYFEAKRQEMGIKQRST